jgi:hypothetical protein
VGMPRFVSLDIGTDYRMFTDLEREKKIVPMILFTIIINKLPIGHEQYLQGDNFIYAVYQFFIFNWFSNKTIGR